MAPDGAHLAGPAVGDDQIARGRAFQHDALGVDQRQLDAGLGFGRDILLCQGLPKLGQGDVALSLNKAQNHVCMALYSSRPSAATQRSGSHIVLASQPQPQPRAPADRTRRADPEPGRRQPARDFTLNRGNNQIPHAH
jgi:hypothetical protein